MARIQTQPIIYKDIDLTFSPHPVTGDVSKKTNAGAIIQSIKNIVRTNSEEILMEPEIAGNITNALFKLNSPIFRYDLEQRIKSIIDNHEPRAEVSAIIISTSPDKKTIRANIRFFIANINEEFSYDIDLIRTR